jgi:DNA-directed RNA polymerase beta' subunit
MKTAEFCCLPQNLTVFCSKIACKPFFDNQTSDKKILLSPTQHLSFPKTELPLYSHPETDQRRRKKPRLFVPNPPNEQTPPQLLFNHGASDARLYGIAYDATWRQVEEFQEFLFYLWEQSFYYESSVPYYAFTKQIEKWNHEIPRHEQSYAIQTGGFAFQHILCHVDGSRIQQELALHSVQLRSYVRIIQERMVSLDLSLYEHRKKSKRLRIKLNRLQQLQLKCKRQIEIFRDFERGKMQPAWIILSYLPVLPPGLRPITSIRGELIVSDINSLYRKVLIRNKRITRGANFGVFDTALSGSWLSWCYNVRQVQEAVDELLKTGSVESGRPLKSLLEGLKGKQGRFRQHLLGKRVDYSGRSVIVVGPQLKIHQCGLPKQMAVELFQPFIIQKLRKKGIVFTTTAAKSLIAERKPIIWSILGEILKTHPILLNRAPTLHRLGIQAFLPQLVEGKAILLHPLVCPAFNADFDGDQMAVHVPLSATTRAEALDLLWSRNHLLAPASGQPLLLPTQDMVLGFYYLTCSLEKLGKSLENLISSKKALTQNQPFSTVNKNLIFSDFSQIKTAYDRGFLNLHTPIWVKWSGFVQTGVNEQHAWTKENVIETRIDPFGHRESLFVDSCHLFARQTRKPGTPVSKTSHFVRTTPGRVFMHSWIFQASQPVGSVSSIAFVKN